MEDVKWLLRKCGLLILLLLIFVIVGVICWGKMHEEEQKVSIHLVGLVIVRKAVMNNMEISISIRELKKAKKGDLLVCTGDGKFEIASLDELLVDRDKRLAKCEELKSELNTLRLQIAKALKEI